MFDKYPNLHRIHHLTPAQLLLVFYFGAIIISTIVLSLPIAYQEGVHVSFIDVLFTAVSALSVTGLSTISIGDTLSTTGVILLALILQLGAVGVMTVSTFIWLLLGKKIGLSERRLIMQDQNQTTFGGVVELIKQILVVVLLIELLGFLILGTYFMRYFPTPAEAYYNGFFSTISAISNGGFSLNNNSLAPYKDDYFVQFIIMLLIVFGAIGFPVLIELKQFILKKRKMKRKFRFSLFTKVTTTTFLVLIVLGAVFIYLIDSTGFFKGKSWHESLFYALFQSVTTRSAGLSTMDVSLLSDSNHLFMSLLMFIGASPSSAGGGIRTTTFALVLIFIITYARGGKKIKVFSREIYDKDLMKAVTVMILAIAIVFTTLLIVSIIEPFSITQLLFEVTSAFGTVGLSLGITAELTTVSKILLMILMFLGRIGLVTFLITFRKENQNEYIRYPKERIIIG
ncbi:TrkH family potassium uptake protein [Pseudogracilibacillus sp. SE30717A]|uniref:TrkH family potassium uptake protein n=1 Tax=Pseudogracilibacillus sp. SE30717A TaxID=3098293 RepID=UPI00300E50E4